MPKYEKLLRDLLTNKRKLEDLSTVIMSEECSAILDGKLQKKMFDPRSFTIPCLIENLSVNNALAELGASINLMPYSMNTKLGLGNEKENLIEVLKENKEAIRWKISDIKCINPSYCTHKILVVDEYKPVHKEIEGCSHVESSGLHQTKVKGSLTTIKFIQHKERFKDLGMKTKLKDNEKGSYQRSRSMKEQVYYNKVQDKDSRPHKDKDYKVKQRKE
nr:hypothetical protein [Tanacetum cinerariifolium]